MAQMAKSGKLAQLCLESLPLCENMILRCLNYLLPKTQTKHHMPFQAALWEFQKEKQKLFFFALFFYVYLTM